MLETGVHVHAWCTPRIEGSSAWKRKRSWPRWPEPEQLAMLAMVEKPRTVGAALPVECGSRPPRNSSASCGHSELVYRLFDISERKKRSQEAQAYDALVRGWLEIARPAPRAKGAHRRPGSWPIRRGEPFPLSSGSSVSPTPASSRAAA